MPTPKQPGRIGKFRSSANSAPVTTRGESVRKTLGRTPFAKKKGQTVTEPPSNVVPAKTVSEWQGQVAELVQAFVSVHKREPNIADGEFWTAYAKLLAALTYYQETTGVEEDQI